MPDTCAPVAPLATPMSTEAWSGHTCANTRLPKERMKSQSSCAAALPKLNPSTSHCACAELTMITCVLPYAATSCSSRMNGSGERSGCAAGGLICCAWICAQVICEIGGKDPPPSTTELMFGSWQPTKTPSDVRCVDHSRQPKPSTTLWV